MALVTLTGRRTGRRYTVPVSYRRTGNHLEITVGWPERKRWWRNLTGAGAPVEIEIARTRFRGHAIASGDESAGVTVDVTLSA